MFFVVCLLSAVCWAIIYHMSWTIQFGIPGPWKRCYTSLSSETKIKWHSRIVSNLHSILAVHLGVCCIIFDDGAFVDPMKAYRGNTTFRSIALMITCGYLVYDLLLCAKHRDTLWDTMTAVHHSVILLAFTIGVATGVGTFYMSLYLSNEISTLFLNSNFFLACDINRDNQLYKVNGFLLLISFLMGRVMYNCYVAYHMVASTWFSLRDLAAVTPWPELMLCAFLTFLAFCHVGLNVVWFGMIVKAVGRKNAKRDKHN